jgi:choice-of-anchor C domain-containing protein
MANVVGPLFTLPPFGATPMLIRTSVFAFLAAIVSFTTAEAAPFTNGSFETGPNPGGSFVTLGTGNVSITGWTVTSGSVDYIGPYWDAAHGVRSIDLNGNNPGSISQTFDTVLGQLYAVTFQLAGNPDGGHNSWIAEVSATGNAPQLFVTTFAANTTTNNWPGFTYHFTATGAATTLRFASNDPDTFYGPALDNVQVSAVPEPTTLVTFGLVSAVGALIGARRRLRRGA